MQVKRFSVVLAFLLSSSVLAKDIVVGVDYVPKRQFALIFTPVVLPDLISAKAAFEVRLHDKINLIIPVESKWMDYRGLVNTFAGDGAIQNYYKNPRKLKWNFDVMQFKIASGLGIKYFPFSESMTNAFFIKTLGMVGFEYFNVYEAEKEINSAVLTGVLTTGYNWVKNNRFTFGLEAGVEYNWHTNAFKDIPALVSGFLPIVQFSLGFTI